MALLTSRAVRRRVEPVRWEILEFCAHCKERIKFSARHKAFKVIANVYSDNGRWQRVEHWHMQCYLRAGEPYGAASERKPD